MERYQEFFIKKGIFLILEKLKTFVYRNLFRKAHRIASGITSGGSGGSAASAAAPAPAAGAKPKPSVLQLSTLSAAVSMNDLKLDSDELECILANLIYQGYIKGYIAHKRAVVLSKTDPFPTAAMKSLG